MDALELLKSIAAESGCRFEIDERGVERMYLPDGTLALTANSTTPEATRPEHMPDDVTMGPDGVCVRSTLVQDQSGNPVTIQVRVCEDCWAMIPHYVDFPLGLTSPESDGDAGGNGAKTRLMSIGGSGKMGMAHLQKIVCLDCYVKAFRRVYVDAPLPALRPDVVGQILAYEPDIDPIEYVDEPKPLGE